jgi:CheY-like chemotaxis protein
MRARWISQDLHPKLPIVGQAIVASWWPGRYYFVSTGRGDPTDALGRLTEAINSNKRFQDVTAAPTTFATFVSRCNKFGQIYGNLLFTQEYKTLADAVKGHKEVLRQLERGVPVNQIEADPSTIEELHPIGVNPEPAGTRSAPSTLRKTKVLVGEDEPEIANAIAEMLGESEYEVAVEYTGLDAVYRSATFQPDIALLGFVMSTMNGVEAGISLSKISPKTKIVLITEPVPAETLEKLKTQGYNFDAFAAPFSPEELRAMIFIWSCE